MSKVLVVEDDPSYGEMLLYQFRSLGHEAELTRSLHGGQELAVSFGPDVVYLDVGLPDGSGLSGIARLKEAPSHPEIIVVTGRSSGDGAEVAIRNGAWSYLRKAGSHEALVFSLQQVLAYRRGKVKTPQRMLDLGGIIGESRAMRACFEMVAQAAGADVNVLVTGESGTGKEMLSLAIHRNSRRSAKPYVVVDCAALPETLTESVLFGHKKGTFTGATDNRVGLLELAHNGTLLLDEVGELPLQIQKAFLRALQERRFRPLGSDREVESDFRLVAATNRNLGEMVAEGRFRQDLLYRLQSLEIRLPPLREREDDVRRIAEATIAKIRARDGGTSKSISPEFYDTLARYSWPGNVRELLNALEYAFVRAEGQEMLYAVHLPTEVRAGAARSEVEPNSSPAAHEAAPKSLQNFQDEATRRFLLELMVRAEGDMKRACQLSGLSRSYLYELLRRHKVERGSNAPGPLDPPREPSR